MAGLFEKQADKYAVAQPHYPTEWYSNLASLTPLRTLGWDVGTGNGHGQAALGLAEHHEQVIATDVSKAQLEPAMARPPVRYLHTPLTTNDDGIISLIN